jgi:hypothetical protein
LPLAFGDFVGALALRQPVVHATFVFAPAAIAFVGNGAGDHVVHEGAVVADQKHGAVVVLQQLFEQLQRVNIQVVGGLVEHQHVGGAGKQAGQQQAVALATAQTAYWRVGAGRREQKVGQVALDVLLLVADFDPLATGADEVFQRGVQVQCVAHLVKVGHRHAGAQAHRAPGAVAGFRLGGVGGGRVGLQLAQNQLEQGGLAGTIGAQQADLVAAQNGGGKVAHDAALAKSFGHVRQLRHEFAAGRAAGHVQVHAAHGFTARFPRGAQHFELVDAPLRLGATRFHAPAHPHLFLGQQLVGAGVDDGLLRHLLFFLQQVGGKVAGVGEQLPAVQLDDAGGHLVQKRPVVGDGDDAALEFDQQTL